MVFADDTVISGESWEQVEESLERWKCALERRGMKVSIKQHSCVNGAVKLQGVEVLKGMTLSTSWLIIQSQTEEAGREEKSARVDL